MDSRIERSLISDLARRMESIGCVQYGDYTLASGEKSSYKVECDVAFADDKAQRLLSKIGCARLEEIEHERGTLDIAGVYSGGWKWAELVASEKGRDAVKIDPHTGKMEGMLNSQPIIFEDIVTRGGSVANSKFITGYNGNICAEAIGIRNIGAVDSLKRNGIELHYLLEVRYQDGTCTLQPSY